MENKREIVSAEEILASVHGTLNHIECVDLYMEYLTTILTFKAKHHDKSKLEEPERSCFAYYGPRLSKCEYNSDEYKQNLKEMGVALKHHYENNSHHPEHWENGINDMTLPDIIEMLCDWAASTKRMKDGSIQKSLEINAKRFGIDKQLLQILKNTVERYFSCDELDDTAALICQKR